MRKLYVTMQELIEATDLLLKGWKKLKDTIPQSRKELAENVQSIQTLKMNFSDLDCIESLQSIVDERNDTLLKQINLYDKVCHKLQEQQQVIKEHMKSLLEAYTKVTIAINEDCDEKVVEDDKFAVEIARLSYSNLLDNHNLRADPPISGVLKDDFRYVRSVLSEDVPDAKKYNGLKDVNNIDP